MKKAMLSHYLTLTEFLGRFLGPDYEILLYDLTDKSRSLVAMSNGHLGEHRLGDPLSRNLIKLLIEQRKTGADFTLDLRRELPNGQTLRCSVLYIKQEGRAVGLFCVNFNDSHYKALSDKLLKLCHPDAFVLNSFQTDEQHLKEIKEADQRGHGEALSEGLEERLRLAMEGKDYLPSEERLSLVSAMEQEGVFKLKGMVKEIAERLKVSQATLYRDIKLVSHS